FEVVDRVCKEIPGGIIAVSGKADADICNIYKVPDCFYTTSIASGDYTTFRSRGTA
ncbi:hypothetical protein DFQ26_002097, partial [Actinomortierella ambigua]